MRHRKPQVGDAGLEVVLEAGDRARQQRAVIGPNALGEVTSDGSRWGLVTGARTRLELRPQVSRDLDGKVAHPMRKSGTLLPSAVACFEDDFEACIAHLRLPVTHRRSTRTTNLLERLFGEERRRLKIIPNGFCSNEPGPSPADHPSRP